MNFANPILLGACGLAAAGVLAWMALLSARLSHIERAVVAIANNTKSLNDLVGLLRSVEGNTSLLGGIGSVFGTKGRE